MCDISNINPKPRELVAQVSWQIDGVGHNEDLRFY